MKVEGPVNRDTEPPVSGPAYLSVTQVEGLHPGGLNPSHAVPSKYGNKKVVVDHIEFDSQAEGLRYIELRDLQLTGEISGLKTQVPFVCEVNGKKICSYFADFEYYRDFERVVEDVKGRRYGKGGVTTAVYRLKKKLVEACHRVKILET